jgi:hypothetical protein
LRINNIGDAITILHFLDHSTEKIHHGIVKLSTGNVSLFFNANAASSRTPCLTLLLNTFLCRFLWQQ